MFQANLLCHPWDFADGSADDTVAFAQGSLGVTGLTLYAGAGATLRLRAHKYAEPAMIRTRGGLYFVPETARYAATRCKPLEAEGTVFRARLDEAADACRARGLELRWAISTLRLGRMAAKYPWAAVRNILDDVCPTRLCPSNPDVVEMLAGLVGDLVSRGAPEAIVLYDFDCGQTGEATGAMYPSPDLGPDGDELLSLCACESCRQAAARDGLDVESALRSARVRITRWIEGATDELHGDELLGRYAARQATALADALAAIRARCGGRLLLHRSGDEIEAPTELAGLSRHVDGVLVAYRPQAGGDVLRTIESARSWCVSPTTVEIEFAVPSARTGGPQTLVADMAAVAGAGVTTVTLADLGRLAGPASDAVRQAIRYARRSIGI